MPSTEAATTVHIINHTHWDREWFLTSIYTTTWMPRLIDKLEQLVRANPDFHYLFDGQTLVIEDLLAFNPEYEEKVKALVGSGNLMIGPYYSQPDWQLTAGETLLRNLFYGISDTQKFGGQISTGWLVDTFGHISQAPQIHRLFGLDAVYVWRGVPQLEPFFRWQGADGQQVLAVNLFGGYRNLYGVTHAPEVAVARLEQETARLRPYYAASHIPLFDGYDLEDNPEDPLTFYEEAADLPSDIHLREATPHSFVDTIKPQLDDYPLIQGELNSGKYGATFPGTFSTRTYLKIMAYDCEQLLYHKCEPLAALARLHGRPYNAALYEQCGRMILQNAVHDGICGVSIDQVHEKMAYHYAQIHNIMRADIETSLAYLLQDFAAGRYIVSTNPLPSEQWQVVDNRIYQLETDGVGVWPLSEGEAVTTTAVVINGFVWQNSHYKARLVPTRGTVVINEALVGDLLVYAEHGDGYSDETGELLGRLELENSLILSEKSAVHSVVSFNGRYKDNKREITATVRLIFDQTPLIRWQIELDSHGTDFRVEMGFSTAIHGRIQAAMPFDIVARPPADRDLLERDVAGTMGDILMGQREINEVRTFPLHDFVAISEGQQTAVVFAKGLRSYQAFADGDIAITLRRSVEWVTKANLENRVGDAGPFFYVPDGRCERVVQHELAFYVGKAAVDSQLIQQLNQTFHNPALIVQVAGTGTKTASLFWQSAMPFSSITVQNEQLIGRCYNPTAASQPLGRSYKTTDVWGNPTDPSDTIAPKRILNLVLEKDLPESKTAELATLQLLSSHLQWRVGPNHGAPDPEILAQLYEKIARLEQTVVEVEQQLPTASGRAKLLLEHRYYIYKRELYEYLLSVRLNELKRAQHGRVTKEYLYQPDEEVMRLGWQLNQLRIKRRIYDYVAKVI